MKKFGQTAPEKKKKKKRISNFVPVVEERARQEQEAGGAGGGGRGARGRGTRAEWRWGADARHGHTRGAALRHGRLGGLGATCARCLGQVGALCTWLSSDSVFDLVLTQYCSGVNFWALFKKKIKNKYLIK